MILKKQVYKVDKKVNPLIGILLFFISIFLLTLTLPLGFIYGIFHGLFKKGIVGLSEYLLEIAISIDQLGNVGMQHLLNVLWIKKGGYKFGNRDETISSALGRNNKLGTLTKFGSAIDQLLDLIDKNHSLNSIDYYIEPSTEIIDQLKWIHIVDQKLLAIKPAGNTKYILPGGQKEPKESDVMTLSREIKNELGIILEISSFEHLGIFEARADDNKPTILVRSTCYAAQYTGTLTIMPEVGEIFWLHYKDREKVSEVDKLIFDLLKDSGQLI
ncbi:NUDIX domain-containing protein [Arenibacter algicola]|uniref:NUDIX hydrolase n=1 Tax=Arenibacter algicola TaxID=616991 RepID=UPI001C07918E|nr:NUDIX domain-containing protein [Arenibacter algicola]MBU2903636.1 NUDIX domain-containing protein [Arenibacter algicola]